MAEMFQFYFQLVCNLTTEFNAAEPTSSVNAGVQVLKTQWTPTSKIALTEESIS